MHPLVTSRPTFYNGSPRVLKLLVLMAVKRRTRTAFSSYFPLCPKARFPLQLKTLVSLPTAHVIPFTTTSDYRSLPPISLTLLSTPRGPVAPFFPAFAFFAAWLLLPQSVSLPFCRQSFPLSLPSPPTLLSILPPHFTISPTSTSSFPVGASVFPAGHGRRAAHEVPSFCSSVLSILLRSFRNGGEMNAASDAR